MDAVKCWASTGLDALVMGPFLLEKQPLPQPEADEDSEARLVQQA
jgi:hypothetical protein